MRFQKKKSKNAEILRFWAGHASKKRDCLAQKCADGQPSFGEGLTIFWG
jgi:hypothetical protein